MSRRGDRIRGRRAHGGVLLVPCLLNDAYRYWFLVDTGAAMTMLSEQAATEMGLDLTHPIKQEQIMSVHRLNWVPVVRLLNLQVGAQRIAEIDTFVLSFPENLRIDGLLGVNVLERFRATFEFDRSTLILR